MQNYDKINKLKEKYESQLEEANKEITALNEKLSAAIKKVDDYRRKLYEVGEGKGEVNKAKKALVNKERELKTVQNQLKEIDGSKLISQFTPKRQQLIKNINNLHFDNKIYDSLATKFKAGLKEIIEIAYRIKMNMADDLDFYTFVFRDNIVGLFEKMLHLVTNKSRADSATRFLQKIINGDYVIDKVYTKKIPALEDKKVLLNIIYLLNIQTTAYHGNNKSSHTRLYDNGDDVAKVNKFSTLDNSEQLTAIFTLVEFMYFFFSCEEWEENMIALSSCWFKTLY